MCALTFQDLVARLHQMQTSNTAHAEVPFEYLTKELHPERQAGQNPFFRVFFAFETAPHPLLSGWSLLPIQVGTGRAQGDLFLIVTEYPEGVYGSVEYRTDLFTSASIERLVGHWLTLLEAAVRQPTEPLAMAHRQGEGALPIGRGVECHAGTLSPGHSASSLLRRAGATYS